MMPVGESKRKLGAFYTPDHTAKFMVGRLKLKPTSRVLEPCGGDGVFVKALFEQGLKNDQVKVWDINPAVKSEIENLGCKIEIKDTLLNTDTTGLFSHSFTHVIGNPPYLNKQSGYIKENKERLRKRFGEIGVNDTYALFIYLGTKLLEENGELIFIVSDTYRTLGIHKKLRRHLLRNFSIQEIVICPPDLFRHTGASVKTSILHVKKTPPRVDHEVVFNDCSRKQIGDYNGEIHRVSQRDLLRYPNQVFSFGESSKMLNILSNTRLCLRDVLGGGLGMHTTNNAAYLARIRYPDAAHSTKGEKRVPNTVDIKDVVEDNGWVVYHKTGGNNPFFKRPSYALKWSPEAIGHYKMLELPRQFRGQPGFIVSGICSRLSARVLCPGAWWESNKAMAFFPKDPEKYPPEFFIGILNSNTYEAFRSALNHTSSVQVRDVRDLPFFDFLDEDVSMVTKLSKAAINHKRVSPNYSAQTEIDAIDRIIGKYLYGEVGAGVGKERRVDHLQTA